MNNLLLFIVVIVDVVHDVLVVAAITLSRKSAGGTIYLTVEHA